MNGNRGAKGSVNDRLISMLYRKRYKDKMQQKDSYRKFKLEKQKEYLLQIKSFDIETDPPSLEKEDKKNLEDILAPLEQESLPPTPYETQSEKLDEVNDVAVTMEQKKEPNDESVETLINVGRKVEHFDPKVEDYDFENYDYYEVISTKTGIASLREDEVLDIDQEISKTDDEIVIVEEVQNFIDESKKTLSEIKFEITDIKADINNQHTQEDIKKLDEKYLNLKQKVDKLYNQYLVMKEKYDFEDYDILDSLPLMAAIDDYRDKAKIDELESLVNICKQEVEEIDSIIVEETRSLAVGQEMEEKKEEIKERDEDFDITKEDTIYLDSLEQKISEEAEKQKKIISEIWENLDKVETELVHTTQYVYNTGQMFSSFLRIATGILTVPLTNRRIFGVMLGAGLINRGLRDLRTSLIPNEIHQVETREKYKNLEREILTTKDMVGTTMKLINDSLYQVEEIKKNFKIRFGEYAEYIPDYYLVEKMIEELEEKLKKKKELADKMQNALDNQYEKNRQKVLRSS